MYLFLYLRDAGKIWWRTMGCAVFTFISGYAAYANKDNTWVAGTLFLTSFVFLIAAVFFAWRDKAKEVEELKTKIVALKASANIAPVQNIYFPALPTPSKPESTKHNVQCVGVTAGENAAQIGFRNTEIPNQYIGKFIEARLRVQYYLESSGEEIAVVFPARWIGYDEGSIEIGPVTQSAVLAFFTGKNWRTIKFREFPLATGWLDRIEYIALPSERIKINATLFGEHNISIPSIKGILTLEKDGNAFFTPE